MALYPDHLWPVMIHIKQGLMVVYKSIRSMKIYLLRHTKPDIPLDTCYGQTDIDIVADAFEKKLTKIQSLLPVKQLGIIYSSPLKRCLKLAKTLYQDHIEFKTDSRLKELNFGDWELRKWSTLDGEAMRRWKDDFVHARAPGGESHMDLYLRAEQFWHEVTAKDQEQMLLVTHGGVIKSLLSKLLEMPLRKSYAIKIHYGELIYIDYRSNHTVQLEFLT